MPTRILRDWTDSQHVEGLSADEERLFTRLIMKADDYGRYHADVRLVRAGCFPLLTNIRDTDISRWIAACEKAGLIVVYSVNGRSYLSIVEFRQRTRQETAKFPAPDGLPPDWKPARGCRMPDSCQTVDRQPSDNGVLLTEAQAQSKAHGSAAADAYPPGMLSVWKAAPKIGRERSSRDEVLKVWKELKLEPIAAEVVRALEREKKTRDWMKENGEFIQGLHLWLKRKRWLEVDEPELMTSLAVKDWGKS